MTNTTNDHPVAVDERAVTRPDGARIVADVFGGATERVSVVCLPGLTRNARDFAELGRRLGQERLVVAVDLRGRGRSSRDPTSATYCLPVYMHDVLALCDAIGIERAVFLGTSMGGQVAMRIGLEAPTRIAGLVLNDIGPTIEPEGIARIQATVGTLEPVANWQDAVAQTRAVSEGQTPGLTDDEWLREARHRYREAPGGGVALDYDPGIVNGPVSTDDPWAVFEGGRELPLLVLRGEFSDILSRETVREMEAWHPGMQSMEIPARGHAPLLDEPEALSAIDAFLEEIDRRRT